MSIDTDKIYICHYKKLADRKIIILDQLQKLGLDNYIFVEQFDKDSWNTEEITKEFPKILDPDNKINNAERSLALKHAWIVTDMHKQGYSSVLVLEDDAVLVDDFVEKYNSYMKQMPVDWDIGWVGSCFGLKEPEIPNINVYKTNRGSRCAHAYCISKSFCINMIDEIKNIDKEADLYYNYIIERFNLNNYWFQPPLALQSLDFFSSLRGNQNHKWDPQEMG
jgi:GR25 family glycosyltransferase involved in LPS biosynthesis